MKKWILALGACAFTFSTPLFAFDVSPTQTKASVVRATTAPVADQVYDGIFSSDILTKGVEMMVVSPDGLRIDSLRGNLSDPLTGDLAQSAKSFIFKNPKLFNIQHRDPNGLKLVRNENAGGADHISYQMNIDGVPVEDSIIDIHIGADKRVQLANGSLPNIEEIANGVTIGRIEALAATKRAIGAKSMRGTPRADLVVLPQNGKGVMAYSVKMSTNEPLGDWEVFIDADTGKEIKRVNQMVFTADPNAEPVTGKGAVYVTNPLKCEVTNEDLRHLTTTKLVGKWANVINEDVPGSDKADYQHIYDPADTHFDEANMYYYINTIHDFYNSLGFKKLDMPMKATVHLGDKYDNAYFSPMENAMAFGDGNRFNDLAKEESVCYHEYSHAAINQIVKLTYSAESGAMNEGQADYFACTIGNDPKIGEWAVAKMGKDSLRNLTDNLFYPKDIQNEVHADGRIWGVVLWDLRNALGAETSDKLIYNGHYYLKPGSPKFIDGLNAILTADKNVFQSANQETILKVFKNRGISTATTAGTVISNQDLNKVRMFNSVHSLSR